MSVLKQADWSFGILWSIVTGSAFVLADFLVFKGEFDLQFILTNIALWAAFGISISIVIGSRRPQT